MSPFCKSVLGTFVVLWDSACTTIFNARSRSGDIDAAVFVAACLQLHVLPSLFNLQSQFEGLHAGSAMLQSVTLQVVVFLPVAVQVVTVSADTEFKAEANIAMTRTDPITTKKINSLCICNRYANNLLNFLIFSLYC